MHIVSAHGETLKFSALKCGEVNHCFINFASGPSQPALRSAAATQTRLPSTNPLEPCRRPSCKATSRVHTHRLATLAGVTKGAGRDVDNNEDEVGPLSGPSVRARFRRGSSGFRYGRSKRRVHISTKKGFTSSAARTCLSKSSTWKRASSSRSFNGSPRAILANSRVLFSKPTLPPARSQ